VSFADSVVVTRLEAELHTVPDTVFARAGVALMLPLPLSHGVARGDARGRVDLEASLDKRLDLGRNVDTSVGLYGAVSADTDGRNEDARFGLMFRMRW
jgi:hypothetical protein